MNINTLQVNKSFKELLFKNPVYFFVIFFYMILTGFNLYNHEMWRDELQIWLIAKNSSSISELFYSKRYDGQPDLWYLLVYLVGHLTDSPSIMQLLHFFISLSVVIIFLLYSPFRLMGKLLLIFGYYFIYEYATISRFYSLGNLLLFIFCALYVQKSKYHLLFISLVLCSLFQVQVFSWMIAAIFGCLIGMDYFFQSNNTIHHGSWKVYICFGIIFFGAFYSIVRSFPPTDTGIAFKWNTTFDIKEVQKILSGYWSGFFPIPKIDLHFWNQNIIKTEIMRAWFGVAIFIISSLFFWNRGKFFYFFIAGEIGMMLFMYIKYPGYQRHQGQLFFFFLAMYWISRRSDDVIKIPLGSKSALNRMFLKNTFLYLVFFSHLLGGLIASFYEWKFDFSAGKTTAEFIKSSNLGKSVIAGGLDYSLTPIAGYLGRTLFFMNGGKEGSFVLFNTHRLNYNFTYPFIKNVWSKPDSVKRDFLFIFNFPQDTIAFPLIKFWESPEAINHDEKYYLYKMKPNHQSNIKI